MLPTSVQSCFVIPAHPSLLLRHSCFCRALKLCHFASNDTQRTRRRLWISLQIIRRSKRLTIHVFSSVAQRASPTMPLLIDFLSVQQIGREQGGDRITCITVKHEVATNNLNGCWLACGCLLQRVQLGEPLKKEDI